jgi:predicted molibdopterin-dependent oxidoreductase YjgC
MFAGITYARIDQVGLQYPAPDETHPGTPFLFADSLPVRPRAFLPAGVCAGGRGAGRGIPFILTTGRLLEHWHGGTMTRHSQLDALYPAPLVEMHEIDAARWQVKTGDAVRVTSRRGSVRAARGCLAQGAPGVVFIPMHFTEAAANLLTIDVLDPQAKIPNSRRAPSTSRSDPRSQRAG